MKGKCNISCRVCNSHRNLAQDKYTRLETFTNTYCINPLVQ